MNSEFLGDVIMDVAGIWPQACFSEKVGTYPATLRILSKNISQKSTVEILEYRWINRFECISFGCMYDLVKFGMNSYSSKNTTVEVVVGIYLNSKYRIRRAKLYQLLQYILPK